MEAQANKRNNKTINTKTDLCSVTTNQQTTTTKCISSKLVSNKKSIKTSTETLKQSKNETKLNNESTLAKSGSETIKESFISGTVTRIKKNIFTIFPKNCDTKNMEFYEKYLSELELKTSTMIKKCSGNQWSNSAFFVDTSDAEYFDQKVYFLQFYLTLVLYSCKT